MKSKTGKDKSKKAGRIALQKLHVRRDPQSQRTALGGLSLACQLARRLGFGDTVDKHVHVLKIHQHYRESDHLLHLVNSIFAGATCIEDGARLQSDEVYKKLVAVQKVTDPSTTGDFLRRFGRSDINDFKDAIWELRGKVWKKAAQRLSRHATVDLDSKVKEVHGDCKQGADYSWKKTLSYHPEVLSLAETGEWVDAVNRPGNEPSGQKAAYLLRRNLPKLRSHSASVCVRGDTKFGRTDVLEVCERNEARVCLCWSQYPNLIKIAEGLPNKAWRLLDRTAGQPATPPSKRRRKRRNLRRIKARKRGYKDKRLMQEHVAEFAYRPTRNKNKMAKDYRMIVIRKQIEVAGKTALFDQYEYRFILTDLHEPRLDHIVRQAYGRSNQENLIEQGQNGVSAFRMPTGQLLANEVWMIAAMLAHCFKSWICLLGLRKDKLSWEWKRFRFAFVYVVARVTRGGRQLRVWFSTDDARYQQLLKGLLALGAGGG